MPVRLDDDGRRSIHAEVEVPGTQEEVWRAVASGPGVSSWFVPTELEERVGGREVAHFGPGMDGVGVITVWEPPRLYISDRGEEGSPHSPKHMAEWTVDPRDGGGCTVGVVHRWVADGPQWDEYFESVEKGWLGFFRILRLYLTHFRNQSCTPVQLVAMTAGQSSTAFDALTGPLGFAGAVAGQQVHSTSGSPSLGGIVEEVGSPEKAEDLIVRLNDPSPGIAHLAAYQMGDSVYMAANLYLYGDQAAATAANLEPQMQAWIAERFPAPATAEVIEPQVEAMMAERLQAPEPESPASG